MRVFSFGGGVQSVAALVLAARGELACDAMLFCNVGEDSENPDTLRYYREVVLPYAASHGIRLEELHRHRKDGAVETLYGRLTRPGSRSIGIPVRMLGNGAPGRRSCTVDFKIRLVASWCYRHGARRHRPAEVMLGISWDEAERMRNDSDIAYTRNAYPLVDRRMTRQDCINLIVSEGLPVPPKSSCWFCPFHSDAVWREMVAQRADLFERACALEETLNARRVHLGKDEIRFLRKLIPLRRLGAAAQGGLWTEAELSGAGVSDVCESGYCMV